MSHKLEILATAAASTLAIEGVHYIPDEETISTIFKLLLQIIIAVVSIIKLLRKDKKEQQ